MGLQVALASSGIFTMEIRLDANEVPEDVREFTTIFWISVTPAVTASADFLEGMLGDVDWIKPFLITPSYSLFFGLMDRLGWSQDRIDAYMQDGAERMVSTIANLENGQFFTAENFYNPDLH